MIAFLAGTVQRKDEGRIVLLVGGVGYLVHVAADTWAALPASGETSLRIHTVVREDALDLYGFGGELEELLFHELLRVPGVGPRTALSILSGGKPEELAAMIVSGDLPRLKKLPGVGKKTAERLVVELPDRLRPFVGPGRAPAPTPGKRLAAARDELLLALAELGYKPAEAERLAAHARGAAPEDASLEKLVREALRAR